MTTMREFLTRWGFDVDFGPLEKMEAEQKKLRSGFLKLGAIATGALAALTAPAATLEDGLRRAAAASGKTGDAFDATLAKLTASAQDLAEELGISGVQIADGFFNVISTGVDPLSKDFDELARTSLRLAKVAGADLGETVSQLNTALVSFRSQGETASTIADKFAKTNTLADTSVGQLAQAMRIAGPVAAGVFGQNIDTTTALLAGFAEAGFKAEAGGEGLKQVFNKLSAPTGDAAKVIDTLGIKLTDQNGKFLNAIQIVEQFEKRLAGYTEQSQAAALKTIFGEETVGKFAAVLKIGSSRLRDLEGNIGAADGSLEVALAQMEGLLDVGRKLFQAIKNIAIQFGSPLLGPLSKAGKFVLNLTTGFREFLKEHPRIVRALALTGGGIAGVLIAGSALGLLITTFKLLGIAAAKMGSELLLTQAKALAFPIAMFALGSALFLFFEDLASLIQGQRSVLGELFSDGLTWSNLLIASLLGVGLAFAVAFAPGVVLVALLGTLAAVVTKNWEAYGQFIDLLSSNSIGDTLSMFGAWLDDLLGISDALEAIDDWLYDISATTFSFWLKKLDEARESLAKFRAFAAKFGITIGGGEDTATQTAPPAPVVTGPGFATTFGAVAPTFAPAVSPAQAAAIQNVNGGSRSIEFNMGGIEVNGVTDPEQVAKIVEERVEQKFREAADGLLED